MQFSQAAQDERRDVPVVAIFCVAVLVLGDSDVGGAVEKTLEGNPRLPTGQWSTGGKSECLCQMRCDAARLDALGRTCRARGTDLGPGWRRR